MPDLIPTSATQSRAGFSYETALERVMGLADFERSSHSPGHSSFHLERIGLLVDRLGNPHLSVPTVHVAGTKGKGSTAAMVTSILSAQGYRVGLYTSPHLHSAVERIAVGLRPIGKGEFAALVEHIWPEVEWVGRYGGYGAVTTFEMLTAMAFLHFERAEADFQVIEVGLGGRLDSTNIVSPEVTVVTSISLDHVATLGNTVEKIAREKAGIVKSGVPVVSAPQPEQAMAVLREVADSKGAPLVQASARLSCQKRYVGLDGQSFEVVGSEHSYDLWTPLLGDHQLENACTAIATVETLIERGFRVSRDSFALGLRNVHWPARLEVLSAEPLLLVVDGAHNPFSAGRLVKAVREYFRFQRVVLIFGALGGHSARGMLSELTELSPLVLAVSSRHPRSSRSHLVADAASELGLPVVFQSENVGKATRRAIEIARRGDLVLATGSLSVAAEVIEEIRGIEPELCPYIKRPSKLDATAIA